MKQMDKFIITAVAGILTLTVTSAIAADKGSATEQMTEKCYGIVKTGLNDCATATASCAGSATKDKQLDAFIFLPKGACDKIVGGNLVPNIKKK